MRGPKPKTLEQRVAEGGSEVSHRPLPHPVHIGGRAEAGELAEAPDHLGADAKEWWDFMVPALVNAGVVDRVDRPGLEMLATAYDDYRKSSRVLASDGHFTRGSVGQLREHPSLRIRREAIAQYNRIGESYGIGPLGRVRLGLAVLEGRAMQAEMDALDDELDESREYIDAQVVEDDDDDIGLPPH